MASGYHIGQSNSRETGASHWETEEMTFQSLVISNDSNQWEKSGIVDKWLLGWLACCLEK